MKILIKRHIIPLFAIAIAVVAMALQSCHRGDADGQKDEKFEVTDSLLNSLLIDTVKEASALSEINLTGTIDADATPLMPLYPLVSGVAHDVRVQLGDVVSKGQTLAD